MALVGGYLTSDALTLSVLITDVPGFKNLIFTPTEERYEKRCVESVQRYINSRELLPSERHESSDHRVYAQAYRAHCQFTYLLTPVWDYTIALAEEIGAKGSWKIVLRNATNILIDNSTDISKHIMQGSYPMQTLLHVWMNKKRDTLSGDWMKCGAFPALVLGSVSPQVYHRSIRLTFIYSSICYLRASQQSSSTT